MAKGSGSIVEIRKKVTKTHEFISTSYHEAGHTIYGLLHLMRVSSVNVFENKKVKRVHGNTYYDYPVELENVQDPDLLNTVARSEVGISYAGLIAEKTLFRSISGSRQTPMFISDGSAEDNKSARAVIKKYNLAPPGPKRSAYKRKLMREVQQELHTHWDAVMLVSHALFKRHRLSYEDLRELLTKKSHNKKFWKEQFKKIDHIHNNSKDLDEKVVKLTLSR